MAKTPKEPKKKDEIELEPDAWERFEGAMDQVVKAPPMHRSGKGADVVQQNDFADPDNPRNPARTD